MKELIRHILREETYSPAGKEVTPNNIVVHKSNPMFRDKIMEQGLKARAGECYKIYAGYGEKCIPAIFATNSTNKRAWFDSTYDDDVWQIDTTMIPEVKWFKDRHYESRSKHIVTFQDIPVEAITLIYEGSGKGDEYIVEGIKPHPKEEEFKQYQGIIDDVVYGVVNEDDLCGFRTEFFLNAGEDALQIVLYYKKGRYPGYEEFTEIQIEIKNTLETYLPIIEMAFVSYDSTRCKETIKENKDTEIENNLKVINTLLSLVSWDGLCDIWVEYNPEDEDYEIRSKTTASYFGDNDVEQELESLENLIRSMGIRVYIYTPWHVKNCEDEVEFMNESDESKQERKFNKLIQKIEDYLNTNEYPSVKKFTVYYDDTHDDVIVNIFFNVEDSIRLGGGINSVIKRVGKQVMEDLEVFPMDFKYYIHFDRDINESKEKSTNELITTVLNTLVLPQYEHVICGFELKNVDNKSLDNVINYPGVTVTFIGGYGTKMWPQTQAVQKMYDDVLDDIWETVWDYTGISLEIYSKYVKDCGKENIYLREQKEKTNYIELLKDIIEPFKNDDCVCDIDMWYDDEDDRYSVYLVFGTEELNGKFTHDGKFFYVRKKIKEVKEAIKSYLPIDNLNVGSYGKPNCKWNPINESKQEDKLKIVKDLIYNFFDEVNFIEIREYNNKPLLKIYYESESEWYDEADFEVNVYKTIYKYTGIKLLTLWESSSFEVPDFYLDSRRIIYDDEGNVINESKEGEPKYLSVIKDITEPFKDEDCVCDISVLYNDEDDMYLIDVSVGTEELNDRFFAVVGRNHYVKTLRLRITKAIKDYLPIDNFYVGSYGTPYCGWKSTNS